MSDPQIVSPPDRDPLADAANLAAVSTKELERLPPETKTMISLIAAIVRTSSGPDPATAKIAAESEMHEESCRLEGYKVSQEKRDKQNERDHEFRMKRLNYETYSGYFFNGVCVIGIALGLFLYIEKHDVTLGTNLMTGCFVALLGPKALLQKGKD